MLKAKGALNISDELQHSAASSIVSKATEQRMRHKEQLLPGLT